MPVITKDRKLNISLAAIKLLLSGSYVTAFDFQFTP